MPPRFWIRYLRRFRTAVFARSLGPIDLWMGLAGAVLGIIDHYLPQAGLVASLGWQVPIYALAAVGAARLVLAPYWIAREDAAIISKYEDIRERPIEIIGLGQRLYQNAHWLLLGTKNRDAEERHNCLVEIVRISHAGAHVVLPVSKAARTLTNVLSRDGSAPFNLRGDQAKDVALCVMSEPPTDEIRILFEEIVVPVKISAGDKIELSIQVYSERGSATAATAVIDISSDGSFSAELR